MAYEVIFICITIIAAKQALKNDMIHSYEYILIFKTFRLMYFIKKK